MKMLERISQHSFLPDLVRRESVVLDLGGNRGEFSSQVRERYGWSVVPVEPTPALAEHLRRLGFDVIQAAVTGCDGTTRFTFDPDKELSGSVLGLEIVGSSLNNKAAREEVEVPSLSFATLLSKQMSAVDLVKVDIEGAELDMFMKATDEELLSIRQFTVEFHDYWYPQLTSRTEEVKYRLKSLGFWMMRAGPNNKDVLFVHPDFAPKHPKRFYVGFWLRNFHGLGRALRLAGVQVRTAVIPKPF